MFQAVKSSLSFIRKFYGILERTVCLSLGKWILALAQEVFQVILLHTQAVSRGKKTKESEFLLSAQIYSFVCLFLVLLIFFQSP